MQEIKDSKIIKFWGENNYIQGNPKIKDSLINNCKIVGMNIKIENSVLDNVFIIGDNITIINGIIKENSYIKEDSFISNTTIYNSFLKKCKIKNSDIVNSNMKNCEITCVSGTNINIKESEVLLDKQLLLKDVNIVNDGRIVNVDKLLIVGTGKCKVCAYLNMYNNILISEFDGNFTLDEYENKIIENERKDMIPIIEKIKEFFNIKK